MDCFVHRGSVDDNDMASVVYLDGIKYSYNRSYSKASEQKAQKCAVLYKLVSSLTKVTEPKLMVRSIYNNFTLQNVPIQHVTHLLYSFASIAKNASA